MQISAYFSVYERDVAFINPPIFKKFFQIYDRIFIFTYDDESTRFTVQAMCDRRLAAV